MTERLALYRLRHRDEAALAWLIDRYSSYINTIVWNIIGNAMTTSDLEEVTSDVFLTLWQNADQIRPGKLKAYLGGIARNKAKVKLRRSGQEIPLDDDVVLIDCGNMEHEIELKEQERFVYSALRAMQSPDREIFLRHFYYYQPLVQIAEELDMNLSTVKTHLRRGRSKLKEIMRKGGYDIEDENF